MKVRVRPYPLDRLPRLARAQAQAGRTVGALLPFDIGPQWDELCAGLGGAVRISLVAVDAAPMRDLHAQARGVVVQLLGPAGRWALAVVDPRLAPRLARWALGTVEPELAAPRALTLPEEGALEMLLGALVEGQPLRVGRVLRESDIVLLEPDDEGTLVLVEGRIDAPCGSGWARLLVPDSLRLRPTSLQRATYHREQRALLSDAPVELVLEAGRTPLGLADLGALEAGDVVVFEGQPPRGPAGGPVRLVLGRGAFPARLDAVALTITEPFTLRGSPMETEASSAPSDELLRELPVEVVCELGRVAMSGRELLELVPGAVIPVGRPLAGPCDLTVGGRVVARGELVDVEGEMGVRVIEIVK